MKKAREHLLQDLVTDWLWMHEDQLGTGLIGHYGYMGNVVVWKINDNGSCDYMDFYEFYREAFVAMLAPYKFNAWQSEEYLHIQDVST
jgi:hypothetical protein